MSRQPILGPGLVGLALLAGGLVRADDPASPSPYAPTSSPYAPTVSPTPYGMAAPTSAPAHRHGLFGRRGVHLCPSCAAKAQQGGPSASPTAMLPEGVHMPPGGGPIMIDAAAMPGGGASPGAMATAGLPTEHGPYLCPKCAAKLRAEGVAGASAALMAQVAPTAADGSCRACQEAGGAGTLMMAEAPGQAIVGGAVASLEPAPIGVVRASYQPAGSRPAGAAPGLAVVGGPSAMPGDAALPPPPRPMAPPHHRRPHILSHMFGLPSLGHRADLTEFRRREAHAAVSYGENSNRPTELPAAFVYGR